MSAFVHCPVYCVKDSVETGLKNLKQSSLMNSAGTFVGDTAMVAGVSEVVAGTSGPSGPVVRS